MKIFSYPIICPSCKGQGQIEINCYGQFGNCPACEGTGTVTKTETEFESNTFKYKLKNSPYTELK